jgi:hypothetical protein
MELLPALLKQRSYYARVNSRKKCNVDECSSPHHPLLHGAPRIFVPPQSEESNKSAAAIKPAIKKNFGKYLLQENSITTLLLTVPIIVEANGIQKDSVGLLDPGSQASLIIDKLAKHLKLEGPMESSPLSTFHGDDPKNKVRKVAFNILTSDTSKSLNVKAGYTVPRLEIQSTKVDWTTFKHQWDHLTNIEPINANLAQVEVLLGRDVMTGSAVGGFMTFSILDIHPTATMLLTE